MLLANSMSLPAKRFAEPGQQRQSAVSWHARFLKAKLLPVLRSTRPRSPDAAGAFSPGQRSGPVVVLPYAHPAKWFCRSRKFQSIDTLRFVGLSAIPFRPSLLGTPHLCFRLLPEPHHPAVRDPRVAPPDRGSAALRQTSETHLGGSLLLGLVMHGVEGLAFQCFPRPTGDGHRLASERLPAVLDRENSIGKAGKTSGAAGGP